MVNRRPAKKAAPKANDDDQIHENGAPQDKDADEEYNGEPSPPEEAVALSDSDHEPKPKVSASKRRKVAQRTDEVEDVSPPGTSTTTRSRGVILNPKQRLIADETLFQGTVEDGNEDKVAEVRAAWSTYTTIPTRNNLGEDDENEQSKEIAKWMKLYQDLNSGPTPDVKSGGTTTLGLRKRVPPQHFLLGPLSSQRVFQVEVGQSVSLADETFPGLENTGEDVKSAPSGKRGWILNVGARVLSIDWCAADKASPQYLAIATERASVLANLNAFKPHPGGGCSIQIWQIGPNEDEKLICRHILDLKANWDGSPRELKWCHELRNSAGQMPFRLLAGIWSDGSVHVVQLDLDASQADNLQEVCIENGLLDIGPDGTVYTCITWLPDLCLAIGAADGTVSIYNVALELTSNALKASLKHTLDLSPTPSPFFKEVLHETYIINITALTPEYPFQIATTSMDGYTTLTDIRNPQRDTITSNRNRIAPSTIAYHRPTQSVLAPDDAGFIRLLPIRRFWSGSGIGKVSAQVTSMATSLVHSSVAIGCTDGAVVIPNPLLKYNNPRHGTNWQQIWFRHEWAHIDRIPDQDLAEEIRREHEEVAEAADLSRPGLVRFVEGFKAEKQLNQGKGHAIQTTKGEGLLPTTIYEVETGITALAWNPNRGWETWLAAGMGSGLVRIEDIGQDE